MSRSHWKWIVAALAVTGPLGFAAFTGHMWEDYFITLRSSRNLVEGHGLVFTPGERVHTFTSPLGVLLPALCSVLAGPDREVLSLWLFRVLNVGFLAAAALLTWRRFDDLRVGAIGRFAFFGLVLADAKLTDFSINGMETAILVFFLLSLWAELERSAGPRIGPLALAFAGLMWTRPDGCIPAALLVISHLLFRARGGDAKTVAWRPLLLGIGVSILIYLPWFLWAWWYYGSPIPHTIIAKSGVTPPVRWVDFALIPWSTLRGHTMFPDLFLPTYWSHGGWPPGLRYFGYGLSVAGAFAWVVPPLPGPLRRASFALFLGMFYVCTIILFPWYSPPWMVLAALVVAFTLDHFANSATAGNVAWLASTVPHRHRADRRGAGDAARRDRLADAGAAARHRTRCAPIDRRMAARPRKTHGQRADGATRVHRLLFPAEDLRLPRPECAGSGPGHPRWRAAICRSHRDPAAELARAPTIRGRCRRLRATPGPARLPPGQVLERPARARRGALSARTQVGRVGRPVPGVPVSRDGGTRRALRSALLRERGR
jgi:hypothetical protein